MDNLGKPNKPKRRIYTPPTLEATLQQKDPMVLLAALQELTGELPDQALSKEELVQRIQIELIDKGNLKNLLERFTRYTDHEYEIFEHTIKDKKLDCLYYADYDEKDKLAFYRSDYLFYLEDNRGKEDSCPLAELPGEIRSLFKKYKEEIRGMRESHDLLIKIIESGVEIYGVFPFSFLMEMIRHYQIPVLSEWSEGKIRKIVQHCSFSDDYLFIDPYLVNCETYGFPEWKLPDTPQKVQDFLENCMDIPLWLPSTLDEFLIQGTSSGFYESKAVLEFEEFLLKHFMKKDWDMDDLLCGLPYRLNRGEPLEEIAQSIEFQRTRPSQRGDHEGLMLQLSLLERNTRLQWRRGHTAHEANQLLQLTGGVETGKGTDQSSKHKTVDKTIRGNQRTDHPIQKIFGDANVSFFESLMEKDVSALVEFFKKYFPELPQERTGKKDLAGKLSTLLLQEAYLDKFIESIITLEPLLYNSLFEILETKSSQIPLDPDREEDMMTFKLFEGCIYFRCQSVPDIDGLYTLTLPLEIREHLNRHRKLCEEKHYPFAVVHYTIAAAVRLYGHITPDELKELLRLYKPDVLEKLTENQLQKFYRAADKTFPIYHYVEPNFIHPSVYHFADDTSQSIGKFLEIRYEGPRWYPKDFKTLLAYTYDEKLCNPKDRKALADVLYEDGIDSEENCERLLNDLIEMVQIGMHPKNLVCILARIEQCKIELDWQEKLLDIFTRLERSTRLMKYNGHTLEEIEALEQTEKLHHLAESRFRKDPDQ